jgi:hypothetical protein
MKENSTSGLLHRAVTEGVEIKDELNNHEFISINIPCPKTRREQATDNGAVKPLTMGLNSMCTSHAIGF